jgi:hypothetical protein
VPVVAGHVTSAAVVLAATILFLFGIVLAIGGVFGLLGTALHLFPARLELGDTFVRLRLTNLVAFFGSVLILGVVHLATALGLFVHRNWARVLGAVLATPGVIIAAGAAYATFVLVEPSRGQVAGAAVGIVFFAGYTYSLLALVVGGEHFRRDR